LERAQIVLAVMPSHHARRLYQEMQSSLPSGVMIVSATKGIENQSYKRMTEVAREASGVDRIAALSGPSFAKEVARGDPSALTVASIDSEVGACVQREFSDSMFRVYTSEDVIGVELGGALKNVIAIAAGIAEGLGFGHNTAAALITRGLAEITRLAVACGARRETLSGLSGMGDLVLTCTGGLSRNRTVGVELGRGRKLRDIMAGMHGMVAEGVLTTDAALGLAQRHGIEMPISEQMHAILHEEKPPREAIRDLMNRPGKEE
jgi:glycerol-3-phosphate dehydrogenase (NAD(P)+)